MSAISIAIPTLNRGRVLCDTIDVLLASETRASEIIIVDQTGEQPGDVTTRLEAWHASGAIRLLRLEEPSITRAMNIALREARENLVLFLDDDIVPLPNLIDGHLQALREPGVWAVVGQVLQPGEEPQHFEEHVLRRGALRDLSFRFNHDTACDVQNVIACNLAVDRARAVAIGGFDENFVAVAYRFETDFALRLVAGGGRIRFEPSAPIRHLRAPGGVRTWGDHRSSPSPAHSMGDYYFARYHAPRFWAYVARRLVSNVATRYHAKHPWAIPGKLIGELRGFGQAMRMAKRGRRLME